MSWHAGAQSSSSFVVFDTVTGATGQSLFFTVQLEGWVVRGTDPFECESWPSKEGLALCRLFAGNLSWLRDCRVFAHSVLLPLALVSVLRQPESSLLKAFHPFVSRVLASDPNTIPEIYGASGCAQNANNQTLGCPTKVRFAPASFCAVRLN